jgi:hypothetical protein
MKRRARWTGESPLASRLNSEIEHQTARDSTAVATSLTRERCSLIVDAFANNPYSGTAGS